MDDFLFENRVANFDPVEIRMRTALIVDGDETVRVDTHTVPSVTVFVAVDGDHGRDVARAEALPHLFDLHRPIVVAIHEQKTRIQKRLCEFYAPAGFIVDVGDRIFYFNAPMAAIAKIIQNDFREIT